MIRQNRFKRFLLRWWKRLWWRVLLLAFLFGSFWVLVWPAVEWFLLPSLPLDAMIVNYTMPYKDDRKHRGLFWVLRHLKVQPPAQRSSWDGLRDYIGYRPSLPPRAAEKLAQRKRRRPGLLYVTDTYGVYRDDLKDEWRKLYIDRSPLVFGGLSMEDARLMERWIRAGTHLFLEFNSMCPPTGPGARKLLQSLLGVSWTGWIGKVFPDPTDLRVAPLWLKRDFKKQYPRRKFPTTPTLFLFNHKGGMLYTSAPKLRSVMPILHLTPAGKKRFPLAHSGLSYPYWFSLMRATPHHETQVYANIQVRQYPAFVKALQQHGLSMSFPALTERRCALRSRCFYAAVDLSDANFSPGGFRRTDTLLWKQLTTAHFTHNMMATFWLLYVPVMTVLLPELARPASGQKR